MFFKSDLKLPSDHEIMLTELQSIHMQNIPCTLSRAGSLAVIERGTRRITSHTTAVLLYSFVADKLIKCVPSTKLVFISVRFSSVNSDPLTLQSIVPVVALQVKVAVDPSVALTDVGVVTKAGI